MNFNIVKIVKIASLVGTVICTIGSAWAGSKENEATLKKLVDQHFQND